MNDFTNSYSINKVHSSDLRYYLWITVFISPATKLTCFHLYCTLISEYCFKVSSLLLEWFLIVTAQLGGFAFGPQCRNWQSTAQGVGLANCRQRPVLGVRHWARGTSTWAALGDWRKTNSGFHIFYLHIVKLSFFSVQFTQKYVLFTHTGDKQGFSPGLQHSDHFLSCLQKGLKEKEKYTFTKLTRMTNLLKLYISHTNFTYTLLS